MRRAARSKKANPIKDQIGQKELGDPSRLMCNRLPADANRFDGCKLISSAIPRQPVPAAGHENFGRGTVAQCGETFSAVERLISKDIGI